MKPPIHETLRPMRKALSAVLLFAVLGAAPFISAAAAAPPAAPAFPAPGATLETPVPQQPLPYVPPLPGMQVGSWRLDVDVHEQLPVPERILSIGPTLVRLDYSYPGKPPLTARQVIDAYRKSLAQAGWQIDSLPGVPTGAVARYAQPGRYLLVALRSEAKALHLTLWEPAASLQSAALREALEKKGQVVIYGITFALNKAQLNLPMSEPILAQILALLKESPALKLDIQAHSDDAFRNVYARRPTQDRAEEIRRWLVAHGAEPARLVAHGYGETKPVAANSTPEGRARNRRVELIKLP